MNTTNPPTTDPPVDTADTEPRASAWIPAWLRETPYWTFSAVMHVLLFLVLLNIFTATAPQKKEATKVKININPANEEKYDPTKQRKMEKERQIFERPDDQKPIVVNRPIPEITPPEPPEGDPDKLSDIDLQARSFDGTIGIAGSPAGIYGLRGRGRLVDTRSGRETEPPLRAALEWLKRHQVKSGPRAGSWRCKDFTQMCKKTCINKDPRYGDGRGFEEHDVGVTALAMLAFAGYGHTHQDGRYKEYVDVLKRSVKYMKSIQVRSSDPNENGRYGSGKHEQWIYDHAIATMAMAELLGMSFDRINLQRSVTDAVKLCLHARNTGWGWKYGIKSGRNDTSVTGWMVLALKAGKYAGLDIADDEYERAFAGALKWFDNATSVSTGRTGYQYAGDEGSRLAGGYPEPYPYSKEPSCMTAVSVLCRLFAGERRSDPQIKRGVDILMRERPQWIEQRGKQLSKINIYYWYYASYAMYQFGGRPWKKWNKDMVEALKSSQRREFDPETEDPLDEDGSWDPIGEWGLPGGRVYSTALGAMTLEVYYRFKRTTEGADG